MSTHDVSRLVADHLKIPTIPAIVQRVQALADDPDASLRAIGAVVAEDPPTAAKVLRIANSAFYGLREPCISPEHATAVLGPRVLRNLVLQASVSERFAHLTSVAGFDLEELWAHSGRVARCADLVARRAKRRLGLSPEELYACGLVHDIGKLVLLENLGESFLEVWSASQEPGTELHVLEKEAFGFDHTEVGALVARRWGLPQAVVEAIQHHHAPLELVAHDPALAVVVVANRTALAVESAGGDVDPIDALPAQLGEALGLTDADVAEILERAARAPESEA